MLKLDNLNKLKDISLSNKIVIVVAFFIAFFSFFNDSNAGTLDIPTFNKDLNKVDLNKPYIIKNHDTLWDIANHFFKNPEKWVSIWKNNHYINNPNLIYPGNKIWFNPINMHLENNDNNIRPEIRLVKEYKYHDKSSTINNERKLDFVNKKTFNKDIYILGGVDDSRIFFAKDDILYIKSKSYLNQGEIFSIFRIEKSVKSLKNKKENLGNLVVKFGKIAIISDYKNNKPLNDIYKGIVTDASEEINSGDILLKSVSNQNLIELKDGGVSIHGAVAYINNDATSASEMQLIIVELENEYSNIDKGVILNVYKKNRSIKDPMTKKLVTVNGEKVGEIAVLKFSEHTLTCVIINSTEPIRKGYLIK